MICFAPGQGGAYVFLSLPATAARQLLVPAALALALECMRAPTRGLVLSTAAAGSCARGRPSHLRDLPLDPVRRIPRRSRALGAGGRRPRSSRARGARRAGRALLALAAADRERHALGVTRRSRAPPRVRASTAGQLVVHSDSSYNLAPEVFTRAGAVAIAALLLVPRRRFRRAPALGRLRRGRVRSPCSRSCCAVPLHLRSPTSSRSRRRDGRPGSCPSPSRSSAGMGVLRKLAGPLLIPLALGAGMFLQIVYPGRLRVRAQDARACVDHVVLGDRCASSRSSSASRGAARRSRCEQRSRRRRSCCLSIAGGLLDLRPAPPPPSRRFRRGS